jgi:hypothetical protein
MPLKRYGSAWEVVIDTASPVLVDAQTLKTRGKLAVESRSLVVLRRSH